MYSNPRVLPFAQKDQFPESLHDPKWFVLFVRSNQEKQTAYRLERSDIEHYLPCFRSVRQWKDRRVTLDMPLFPGYLFVRIPFIGRSSVLTLPNVISLVGGKNSPAMISDEEISQIKKSSEHGGVSPHPYLRVGQRVAITAGVLRGMEGILQRHHNSARVVVCLDSIERAFAVEVDAAWIKPLTRAVS